jgi:hypothetical protein
MILPTPYRLVVPVIAIAAVLACPGSVEAGWLTIKNDTCQTIAVQETAIVNGKVRRGKPTNLLAGETLREYIPGPTTKTIDVFDLQKPRQPLWSGSLNCPDEMQTFSISSAGGRVMLRPIKALPMKK